MKKSMERQSIGNSGYGRFLCTHYSPGSSFISSLNSISQKYETKIKEKKRLEKERWRKELKLGSDNPESIDKFSEKDKKESNDKEIDQPSSSNQGKEESKKSVPSKVKPEKPKSQQTKSEKKGVKEVKSKGDNDRDQKRKVPGKAKDKNKQKEESKVQKPREKKAKVERKVVDIDTSIEKVTENLKDEVNIAELQK